MNKRRKLIVVLGAGALAAPFGSFAQQQSKVWRVGILSQRNRPDSLDSDTFWSAFRLGMAELGYIEGKNLAIEWRYADGKVERLPGLAAELVQLKVNAIVTAGSPPISAAQKATTTIPIVIASAGDPVGSGFVQTLARPGGNITGLSNLSGDLGPKLLEMLRSIVPKLSRVGVLVNLANSSHATILKNISAATKAAGVKHLSIDARSAQEIENALSTFNHERVGAVIVVNDPTFNQQSRQIAELAAKHHLPSIAQIREFAEAGGLLSYGQNLIDSSRRAATYVDKIFKGANPGDLPVEQPTKFELLINRKTANSLGLTIPKSLLVMADKVIE